MKKKAVFHFFPGKHFLIYHNQDLITGKTFRFKHDLKILPAKQAEGL